MECAYFSASLLSFIPEAWAKDGTYTKEAWPADAVLLNAEQTAEYWKVTPPTGKQIGVVEGAPAWVDIPPLSAEFVIALAEQKRAQLRGVADSEIEWRQDAVDAGIATEEEITDLAAWKKYRVLLMRVDAAAPAWPTIPEKSMGL